MKTRTLIISLIILLVIIIISVIYTTVPRLELNGVQNMTISYREKYEEPGVILKNANTKYLNKVKIEDNIENSSIGIYYVDYSLKLGTRTLRRRRNVKIIDDIPPVIKLNGEQITEISINKEYKEPGYKAIDEYEGDITDKVEITGKVDTTKYGEYIIKYKVKDNSNNSVEVNRIVKVIDEEPPKFDCESEYTAVEKNQKNIVGCKVIDNFDGDITEKVTIKGQYDINQIGVYPIQYSVRDDAGNTSTINHNIIIHDQKEKEAYIVTEDIKEIKEQIKTKEINATIINPTNQTEEYKNELIEKNYQIGLKTNDKTLKNIKDLEGYCNINNIPYININKTQLQQAINQILYNQKDKIIIIIEEKTDTKDAKTIIQILKEMNYKFDTLDKIK